MPGDSYARVYFWSVPAREVVTALAALDAHGFAAESPPGPGANWPPVLDLDEPYRKQDAWILDADEVAHALGEAAPGAIFQVWSDPAEDSLGVVRMHVPGLGLFASPCAADGDPVVDGDAIRTALADATVGPRSALLALIGQGWTNAISTARVAVGALHHDRQWVAACPYDMADCDRPAGDSHQACRIAAEAMEEAIALHPVRAAQAAVAPAH